MQEAPVLIVGGLGKTGRRVADRLTALGKPVRIASRSTEPHFNWTDRASWPGALTGISTVYVTYQPDLAVPGAVDDIATFGRIAAEAGVKRVILLSGRGEDGAVAAEEALKATGVRWTILRATWFAQNFSESYFLDGIKAGELALPAGEIPEPFVHADDIADVALAAIIDERHDGQTYELTGPRALTFAQAVEEIAQAAGRPIFYIPIAASLFATELKAAGLPDDIIELLHELFTQVLDGRNSKPMDGVERALGRPPLDFSDYVRETAATGIWSAQS
jgi:uncharacterized protein YbjT (DUF2867 family)